MPHRARARISLLRPDPTPPHPQKARIRLLRLDPTLLHQPRAQIRPLRLDPTPLHQPRARIRTLKRDPTPAHQLKAHIRIEGVGHPSHRPMYRPMYRKLMRRGTPPHRLEARAGKDLPQRIWWKAAHQQGDFQSHDNHAATHELKQHIPVLLCIVVQAEGSSLQAALVCLGPWDCKTLNDSFASRGMAGSHRRPGTSALQYSLGFWTSAISCSTICDSGAGLVSKSGSSSAQGDHC